MKHTPIPLTAEAGPLAGNAIIQHDGHTIAVVYSSAASDSVAIASEIVRAVNNHEELLDMLEKAVDFIKHEPLQSQGVVREIELRLLTTKIQAAIANATGE